MDDKTVSANIAELITRLNHEFEAAFRLGLKVMATTHSGIGTLFSSPQPERISIRVWRETEMVRVPVAQVKAFDLAKKGDVKR